MRRKVHPSRPGTAPYSGYSAAATSAPARPGSSSGAAALHARKAARNPSPARRVDSARPRRRRSAPRKSQSSSVGWSDYGVSGVAGSATASLLMLRPSSEWNSMVLDGGGPDGGVFSDGGGWSRWHEALDAAPPTYYHALPPQPSTGANGYISVPSYSYMPSVAVASASLSSSPPSMMMVPQGLTASTPSLLSVGPPLELLSPQPPPQRRRDDSTSPPHHPPINNNRAPEDNSDADEADKGSPARSKQCVCWLLSLAVVPLDRIVPPSPLSDPLCCECS